MLKIYLTRHGQNEDNAKGILNGHRDLPLTAIGLRQAEELACGIKKSGLNFDAVYTSPLIRASRTAEVVCEKLGLPAPTVLDLLIERDFGVMTGQLAIDIERLCGPDIVKTGTITYFLSPPGAETFTVLVERASKVLAKIRSRYFCGNILLVTHGDFGKMIYTYHYGLDWRKVLHDFHFGNCELLLLAPGGTPENAHVLKIGQYNH